MTFTPQASAVPGSAAEHEAERAGASQTEVFPLTMLAVGGMLVFPAANDLLTMFVALEVLSLPLYLLCGLARHRRLLSQEAAVKYFLLGAFSSAFFLYGVALLYGSTGTLSLPGIAKALAADHNHSLALTGVALLSVGLLFKVGAVPFHSWIPDVYQGAPTPITGFMAAATKVAAFGALLRVVYVALPPLHDQWRPGAVGHRNSDDRGRHGHRGDADRRQADAGVFVDRARGFPPHRRDRRQPAGLAATMFYLVAYSFSTVGAFAVVSLIRNAHGEEDATTAHWAGLGQRYPVVGLLFSMFLLAFAGIPLTSGFISKFAVFSAAAKGGAVPLVIVGVIGSAVAAYFYVRVIVLMFFTEPHAEPVHVVMPSFWSKAAIAVCAAITDRLGHLPAAVARSRRAGRAVPDMTSTLVVSDDSGAVRLLTMNRPAARNALSPGLIEALYTALREADDDPSVRAVVLTGADPAFCAGVDLKEAQRLGPSYFEHFQTQNCIRQTGEMRTPVDRRHQRRGIHRRARNGFGL